MSPENERGDPGQSRPNTIASTTPIVSTWADVHEDAQRWVRWTARRRWPGFACNDAIWAASVTDWELHGRRAA
jgi:hypothetical protein